MGEVSEQYVTSKDNHKICTQVVVHLFKGMYELVLNAGYEFLKLTAWPLRLRFVYFILNRILLVSKSPKISPKESLNKV